VCARSDDAQYKFYFAFENVVQDGYVTEKLLFTLNFPIIPVYYGAVNAPNVTSLPSYVRASDFPSPAKLAAYLLHLDTDRRAYDEYLAWRDPNSPGGGFAREYLNKLIDRVPGPAEYASLLAFTHPPTDTTRAFRQLVYYKSGQWKYHRNFLRRAQCCRLCNETFARAMRGSFVHGPWPADAIRARFFG
jgi:hypothetical protein